MTENDARLLGELREIFADAPLLDGRPVLRFDVDRDGEALTVCCDMPGGVLRMIRFAPGEAVRVTDHGGMH